MEVFKVICVTCQAKLSVRNEALIGQIVACPRCNSMVEIARPAAAPTSAAPAESTGSTINITARQADELKAAAESTPEAFDNSEIPTATDQTTTTAAASPEASAPDDSVADPPTADPQAAAAHKIEALQASVAVARYKMITWSLASFVIGASIVGAVIYKRNNATEPSTTADNTTPAVAQTEVSLEPNAQRTPPEPTGGERSSIIVPDTQQPADESKNEPEADEPKVIDEPTTPTTPPTTDELATTGSATVEQEPKRNGKPQPVSPVTETTDESPVLTVEPAPRLARKFDPLDYDPERLSLSTVDQPQEPPTAAVEVPEPPTAAAAETIAEQPPAELVVARLGENSDADVATRDAEQQLSLLIPALEFEDLPLVDAIELISQLSGQPVSVAPHDLLMAGITAEESVSFAARNASLDSALGEVLKPLRLEHSTDGPQIVVRRREADKLREIKYPVDDLVAGGQSEEELAGWIEQLVAPQTWQSAGGAGTLVTSPGSLQITQPQHVQYQILILLERLRLARELSPQSRYPVEQLAGRPAQAALADQLTSVATFTFTQPTPLREVLSHWRTELGVPLLVDWPALADAGIWPGTTITCSIHDESWETALDKTLAAVGLGWRVATGGAIEITSAESAKEDLQLELYPLRNGPSLDADTLSALTNERPSSATGVIVYDSVGNVVLSLQPAATQRQIYRQLRQENLLHVN